jgi:radical SAM family uncharacterized protein/radical SAM-linked protein
MDWEDLLIAVEKPSRYLGTEVNAVRKGREAELRFVLAFPDTYEVGMSHLGIQILYELLNRIPTVAAERCFAPWPDMERLLRKKNLLLTSLETRRSLHAFDLVGFSLQYELSYTNVLNMLELGGIPLLSSERGEGTPVIIAGGPCAFNPAPMAAFIDAFVIGEGEEVILEIAAAALTVKERGGNRADMLSSLADIAGIYVPALHEEGKRIRKRIVSDLNMWCLPTRPVVPLMKTIHDRITLEIARGCTRGCRFCQAGMVWRPVREREQAGIEGMAEGLLCATGYDEISLLSLSSGDYSRIEPLLATLMERYYEKRVALALPSLRAETLTRSLIENIRRVRKTSFTLAPEAGTQRLRNIINKGNSSEELLATTEQVFAAGWKSIKLYFMLGLPEETQADLEGIVELAYQTLKTGQQRGQVTVSLSTFVPKSHTPFQWQRQISLAETRERQFFLKDRIRHRNISVKWHDAKTSLLEGILSRGDARTGELIAAAFRLGCRFDGWTDQLRFDLWEQAMAQTGVNATAYLEARDHNDKLPWDRIDCGVDRDFLLDEAKKALAGAATPDCRNGLCHNCGVCDQETIRVITATAAAPGPVPKSVHPEPFNTAQDMPVEGEAFMVRQAHHERRLNLPERVLTHHEQLSVPPISLQAQAIAAAETGKLFRIKFAKLLAARFLSHAELSEALIRAIKRQGLTFVYSQGYHPHPRISFAIATSVGMESQAEYADIQVVACAQEPLQLQEEINALLPAGLKILDIKEVTHPAGSLSTLVTGFTYTITLSAVENLDLTGLQEKMAAFLQSKTVIITRETGEKKVAKDIRPFVFRLVLDVEKRTLILTALISPAGTVRPIEILTHVLGIGPEAALQARIVKTETHWRSQ